MDDPWLMSKEYEDLFNGKLSIPGNFLAYENLLNFLKDRLEDSGKRAVAQTIAACVALDESPHRFCFSGKTKSGEGDGVAWSDKVAKVLPILTESEREGMTETLRKRSEDKGFRDVFVNVNITMVRRIAKVSCEHMFDYKTSSKILNAHKRNYGCKPSEINTETNVMMVRLKDRSEESFEIKRTQINKHKADKVYWNTDDYKRFYYSIN